MYLADVLDACDAILEYTRSETEDRFRESRFLRSATEREFAVVGEAVVQALKIQPNLSARISNCESIARFRNLLVHAYDLVDPGVMWKTVVEDVPVLRREVAKILDEIEGRPGDATRSGP